MLEAMQKATRHFPARLLTPGEHALVAEWLAVAGDISSAYVSDRRADDPAYYRRIVVINNPADGPSHLVSAAAGRDIWIVFSLGRRTRIQTLSDSPSSIELYPASPCGSASNNAVSNQG
jgi:hypothetical protein